MERILEIKVLFWRSLLCFWTGFWIEVVFCWWEVQFTQLQYWVTSTTTTGSLNGHSGAVRMCCFSPDSGLLATASGDYTVRVWDVNTLNCLSVLDKHDSRLAQSRLIEANLGKPHIVSHNVHNRQKQLFLHNEAHHLLEWVVNVLCWAQNYKSALLSAVLCCTFWTGTLTSSISSVHRISNQPACSWSSSDNA